MSEVNYNEVTPTWEDSQLYSPSSAHRRRLIIKILKKLDFKNFFDVGCAQGYLINTIEKTVNSTGGGRYIRNCYQKE